MPSALIKYVIDSEQSSRVVRCRFRTAWYISFSEAIYLFIYFQHSYPVPSLVLKYLLFGIANREKYVEHKLIACFNCSNETGVRSLNFQYYTVETVDNFENARNSRTIWSYSVSGPTQVSTWKIKRARCVRKAFMALLVWREYTDSTL